MCLCFPRYHPPPFAEKLGGTYLARGSLRMGRRGTRLAFTWGPIARVFGFRLRRGLEDPWAG